jgi:hypothetical protein
MDRSDFHIYALEIAVFVGIIVFLIFFQGIGAMEILYDYGVPLLIYIAFFAAYPIYKIVKGK